MPAPDERGAVRVSDAGLAAHAVQLLSAARVDRAVLALGDAFAEALIAKAREGVPVRLVVDRNGSDPERSSREFYDRLVAAGIQICSARGTVVRAPHTEQ